MKLSLYLGLLLFALPAYAGPADPPTLPALPDPQMVGISRFSVADIAELPTPGNPPTGILRLYADSGSGQLKCLTPTGTSCLSSGGGGTPGGSPTQLQFNNTTFGGATFNYNAAGSCQEITITCDNISNDGSVPGSGFVVDAGGSASEFNFISAATAPAASGGGMLKVYTASSNGVAKNVGPEAVAGFFRASVATVGAQAVAIQGKAATFATDATDGQSLDAVTAAIALNNTRVGSLVADATAIYLTAPLCDFGGCVTVQKATNLYGLKIGDQAGFSTTEQAAIKILSQTAGSGTTFSIKCDIGCGVASFGNGVAFPGSSSGTATVVAQAAASTPTLTLPTGTGTFAVTASSPLVLDATTGALTCPTCSTTTGTVTSVATTGPITGGTITSTGTIACATCGVTGSPLSQFASTTSLQLAGVISDETGSGALVFATTPTLVTPVIGAATGTSLVLSAQLTSAALSASGLGTFTGAGAASTNSVKFNGTLFTGGSGTTTFPNVYIDPGGANTQPTTWSTNGTLLGLNAPTGFTGKMLDVHLNGGSSLFSIDQAGGMAVSTIASSAGITAAAGSNIGLNGRTQFRSAADGRITINNNANASLGMTRVSFGTEAATNPAFAPLNTILDVVDGAGTSTLGNTTLLSANGNKVFVTTNFTTAANTALQTITGLTFNFSAVAHNWNFSCHLAYSQATGTAAVAFGIQAATNNPTNIFATGELFTAAGTVTTGTLATLATTTATNIVSGTPGATATNNVVDLYGTLELAASANAVNIMVSTATSADAVTVLRGSSCQLF